MLDLLRGTAPSLSSLLVPELMEKVTAQATTVAYEDGQLVHQRGDAKPGLSIVKSGQVIAGNVGVDGALLMISIIEAGNCFGEFSLFAGLPRTHDIYSSVESEIDQLSKARFMKLSAQYPEIAEVMLALAWHRNHALLEYLDNLRRRPLLVRTAQMLSANVKSQSDYQEVRCKQDELAFSLGVSSVSVGKVLTTLQNEELIQLGYGKIIIPSATKLKSWLQARTLLAPLKK
jgi:CRP-like cAMP-binding protein